MKNILFSILFLNIISISTSAQDYDSYVKLKDTTIYSTHLGFDKHVTITVPFDWQEESAISYPLVVVFDRQNPRSHQYILNTIDYMTSNDQMPASIIISIESEQEYRYRETTHRNSTDKGNAMENEKFLFDELIPLAEKAYQASDFRLLIGHSRYGYFTTSLLHKRPNDVNAVISLSPFFNQPNVSLTDSMAQFQNMELNAVTYYRYSIGNDYPADFASMDATLQLIDNPYFDTKGFYFQDATHNVTPGLSIATSLYEIFEYWSMEQSKFFANSQTDLSILPDLHENINTHYGSQLPFSLGVLNGKGWFFYNEGQHEKAIATWKMLLESRPNFLETYISIINAKIQLKEDATLEIEKYRNAIQTSTVYSMEEKEELNEWLDEVIK